jgi:hypothetical protein
MEDNNLEKYLREMYKDDNIRTRAIEVIKKEKDAGHIRSSSEGDMNGSGLLIVFSTYRPIIENGIIVGISYYDVVPKEQHVLAWNNKGYFIDSSYKISFNLLDFRKIPVLGFVEVEKNKVNVTKP